MTKRIVLVRSEAGIFVGSLEKYENTEASLTGVRRLWYWTGAATLSQLAQEGTRDPKNCKAPCAVDRIILPAVIEMLDVTTTARKTIEAIPVWSV